jgi:hypothetical protein
MRFAIGYFVFGTMIGIWVGAHWPPESPAPKVCPHPALSILQSATITQTPHLRASHLLASR